MAKVKKAKNLSSYDVGVEDTQRTIERKRSSGPVPIPGADQAMASDGVAALESVHKMLMGNTEGGLNQLGETLKGVAMRPVERLRSGIKGIRKIAGMERPEDMPAAPNPSQDDMGNSPTRASVLTKEQVNEGNFKKWYAGWANKYGLDPNPDAPEHQYDYRAAFEAGVYPDGNGHWPSRFKRSGHPNRFVEGVDTMTNTPYYETPSAKYR